MIYKISSICDINKESLSATDLFENILYLDTSSITCNAIACLQAINIHEAPSRAKRKVKHHTIVYSTVRPNLKHFGILSSPAENMIVSTGFATLDIKKEYESLVNPEYIYYLITNQSIVNFLSTKAESAVSAYPSINPSDIGDLAFDIPSFEEQKRVVSTLNPIEHKLTLNTHLIAELESMAQQLYDYWFVQFDFPDESGRPYKSNGGKMVWNEKLKREIPEGWEVKKLNQVSKICRGVTYSKDDLVEASPLSMLVLRGNNIPQSGQFAYDSNIAYIPKALVAVEQQLNEGDIILTMSSGSKEHIGKCFMFQYNTDHTFGAFLSKIVPEANLRYYIYLFMLSDYFKALVQTTCNGTGINNLTNETFNDVFVPIPKSKVLNIFETYVSKVYNEIGIRQKEIFQLTHLRNSLLPLLMNGQVTVKS